MTPAKGSHSLRAASAVVRYACNAPRWSSEETEFQLQPRVPPALYRLTITHATEANPQELALLRLAVLTSCMLPASKAAWCLQEFHFVMTEGILGFY